MTSAAPPPGVPFGTKLHQVAEANPDGLAITFAAEDGSERTVTFGELDRRTTQVARVLARRGLGVGDLAAIRLKNSPELVYAAFAAWKLGAVPVPVRWDLPDWELERVDAVIGARVSLSGDDLDLFEASRAESTDPLPEVIPPALVGHLQLGVDRDAQGHPAPGSRPVRPECATR